MIPFSFIHYPSVGHEWCRQPLTYDKKACLSIIHRTQTSRIRGRHLTRWHCLTPVTTTQHTSTYPFSLSPNMMEMKILAKVTSNYEPKLKLKPYRISKVGALRQKIWPLVLEISQIFRAFSSNQSDLYDLFGIGRMTMVVEGWTAKTIGKSFHLKTYKFTCGLIQQVLHLQVNYNYFPQKKKTEWNSKFPLCEKWIIFSLSISVHLHRFRKIPS